MNWRRLAFSTLILIASFTVALVIGFLSLNTWMHKEVAIADSQRILTIEKGQTVYGVSNTLHQQGLLDWPVVWRSYARFIDHSVIRAGEFMLNDKESPYSILKKIQSADVVQYKVTFVEGIRAKDALQTLLEHKKFQAIEANIGFSEHFSHFSVPGIEKSHIEGWIYPDTYQFSVGDRPESILLRAHKKMQSVLKEEWENRSPNLPLKTPYEALILASIIEKETGAPHERKQIAGVFTRRLNKGMRLQTDPTVIYGMGEEYKGNITRADLRRATAYNTYVIKGLPPTPIALPGRAAIHAALNPEEGDALYFVAKGDGTHIFSATLAEHQQAVKAYQLSRRKNYRSQYVPPKQDQKKEGE